MSEPNRRDTAHSCVVSAPADVLYGLVADVTRWPVVFEPCVHARFLERGAREERIGVWARVGGEVRSWTSRRLLDPARLRIAFRQERGADPIASMSGAWSFRALAGVRTEVVLTHSFTAAGDGSALDWIAAAVDANSERELAALRRLAEQEQPVDELVFSFTDQVRLPGAAADAYEFVRRADLWPRRLPHVGRVRLTEDPPGVQDLEMDTVTADGTAHTTRSIRLCFPAERIVYKQLVPPALLFGHSGAWDFAPARGGGSVVTARHTVGISPGAVREALGAGVTLAEARGRLREALGANSRATIAHAGEHAHAAGVGGGTGAVA
ncbi:aromatase/cyclase [Allonocardiopsis opalescens]|uniref:Aromatase n=1 Tax=Allonocardiopsis opalescens TaxID=1144618 RepID=A0A2T0Q5W1_9ACTN|nr:aromatase/cyclase [Allonocardiopsis opalescens]PRX99101.1 aromatase [Allonocardiopsis opalescens]